MLTSRRRALRRGSAADEHGGERVSEKHNRACCAHERASPADTRAVQPAALTRGQLLREVREACGITQAELACDTGLHEATIRRVEHDVEGQASDRARRLIAHHLGAFSLLYGEEAS